MTVELGRNKFKLLCTISLDKCLYCGIYKNIYNSILSCAYQFCKLSTGTEHNEWFKQWVGVYRINCVVVNRKFIMVTAQITAGRTEEPWYNVIIPLNSPVAIISWRIVVCYNETTVLYIPIWIHKIKGTRKLEWRFRFIWTKGEKLSKYYYLLLNIKTSNV